MNKQQETDLHNKSWSVAWAKYATMDEARLMLTIGRRESGEVRFYSNKSVTIEEQIAMLEYAAERLREKHKQSNN